MALTDGAVKETFGKLPPAVRHSLSWALMGGICVVLYMGWIRDPLSAATLKNADQDAKIASNTAQIQQLTNSVQQLVTSVATQQANINAQQQSEQNRQDQLNRMENKIDRLRGR